MNRLVVPIACRQIRPLGAGAHNPEDSVENGATVAPRHPSLVGANRVLRKDGADDFPLTVGQVHPQSLYTS